MQMSTWSRQSRYVEPHDSKEPPRTHRRTGSPQGLAAEECLVMLHEKTVGVIRELTVNIKEYHPFPASPARQLSKVATEKVLYLTL